MKKVILALALLIGSAPMAFAENWICYDPNTTPANQITVRANGDCKALGLCSGNNNSGLLPNCFEAIGGEYAAAAFNYKKVDTLAEVGSRIIDWTVQEISDHEAQQDLNADLSLRASAKEKFDGQTTDGQALRCFADIVMKEVNILRKWTLDYKGEVAAATNLANLQDRVATLPSLADRTLPQLKGAIQQCIDDGNVDE